MCVSTYPAADWTRLKFCLAKRCTSEQAIAAERPCRVLSIDRGRAKVPEEKETTGDLPLEASRLAEANNSLHRHTTCMRSALASRPHGFLGAPTRAPRLVVAMSKRLGSGDFTVGHGVHSQAPAESIRQWVHRETRRQERATHTPAGEPIEKLFESRTRSLQELRDLQLGLHMRMQARATGSLGRSAATTSGVAQDPASATTTGRVEAPATTQALLAHETGAMDRRVGDPGHAASVQARVSSAKYMPHLVHHSDLGWGYQGIKNQELLGQFKKSADRGVRYGESMKFAMEASRWKNATLDR